MNIDTFKKRVVLILAILLISIVSLFTTTYLNSLKNITVRVDKSISDYSIGITKEDNTKVAEVSGTELTKKIQKGKYIVTFSGEKYKTQTIKVSLDKSDESLTITPSFNDKILGEMLDKARGSLIQEVNARVPQTKNEFVIDNLKLYFFGEWASAKIHIAQTPEEEKENYIDVYRVVLKKDNNTWKLVTDPPELLISIKKYPTIPRELLVQLNKNPEDNPPN